MDGFSWLLRSKQKQKTTIPKIRGEATICKNSSSSNPFGMRFNIAGDKQLVSAYASRFMPGGKIKFLFYEDSQAQGGNPAEWIARKI